MFVVCLFTQTFFWRGGLFGFDWTVVLTVKNILQVYKPVLLITGCKCVCVTVGVGVSLCVGVRERPHCVEGSAA